MTANPSQGRPEACDSIKSYLSFKFSALLIGSSTKAEEGTTGGSHLSRTAVKPDSRFAQIFVAKFLCIIRLIIING